MKIIFWDVTPCDLVDVHVTFLEKYSASVFGVEEAAPSSESSARVYRIRRRDVPSYRAILTKRSMYIISLYVFMFIALIVARQRLNKDIPAAKE
jgi:hypothetical protein